MAKIKTYMFIATRQGVVSRVSRSFVRKTHYKNLWEGIKPYEEKGATRANALSILVHTMKQLEKSIDAIKAEGQHYTVFIPSALYNFINNDTYLDFIEEAGEDEENLVSVSVNKETRNYKGVSYFVTKDGEQLKFEADATEIKMWLSFKDLIKEVGGCMDIYSFGLLRLRDEDTVSSKRWKEGLKPYLYEAIDMLPEQETIEAEFTEVI